MWCSLLMHGVAFSDDWRQWEWGESESNQSDREKEREKTNKIINAIAIVTLHICTVTITIVHKCTILHPLMWVFFCSNCVKWAHFSILHNFVSTAAIALTHTYFDIICIFVIVWLDFMTSAWGPPLIFIKINPLTTWYVC